MVTSRRLEVNDLDVLESSIAMDDHHRATPVEFFCQPGTVTNVYEDEDGPVLYCRGSKALRLDIQYLDNKDAKRNMRVMLEGFPQLVELAKANGFQEIIFNTRSGPLLKLCKKRLGFIESHGELRRFL